MNLGSLKALREALPDGWSMTKINGRVHIKEPSGLYSIEVHPIETKTPYVHMHFKGRDNDIR